MLRVNTLPTTNHTTGRFSGESLERIPLSAHDELTARSHVTRVRRTIGTIERAVVLLIVTKFTFKTVAIAPRQCTLALAFIIGPRAHILLIAARPVVRAEPIPFAIAPTAGI